ncbi:hypothetical protein MTP99_006711 [Tenebrio molitor]|nr:hypothetical protein MTP99_006711 [Tenebrio molitor]
MRKGQKNLKEFHNLFHTHRGYDWTLKVIPTGFMSSTEAKIFLCEEFEKEKSHCYWFLVSEFGGTKIEVGKCIAKSESCKKPIKTIMHNNSESWNLTNEEWRHFELSKKDNRLSFRRLNSNDAIIQYDDSEEAYKITAMVFYGNGFWKIHAVPYLYTNQNTKQKTTVVVQPKNGVVCLSLFVKMCFNCKLTLTLSEENDENNILKEETYSSQGMWREIKMFVDNVQVNSTLFISTIANNQSDLFWNIDPNIRECHNTGKTNTYDECG